MLIKGVNRKIIEIKSPESAYFEKAILYVRPDMSSAPTQLLRREAEIYISGVSRKRRKNSSNIIFPILSIVLLSVIIILSGFFIK